MPIRLSQARYLRLGQYLAGIILAAVLAGCDSEKPWQLNDVSGHLPDLQFSLISDQGQAVTEQNYRDYPVMMFFGFTRCPSECPTTFSRLAKILQHLGPDADRIRILFVTLAPAQDRPPVLQRYVAAFDAEHAIGLTGEPQEIEALAKRYRIAYRLGSSATDGISHSTAVYIFDAQGHARLLLAPDDAIDTAAEDLRRLAASHD